MNNANYKKAKIEGPSDKTRNIALRDAHDAFIYALYIDKKARDDTRQASCRDEDVYWSFAYAMNLDQAIFHDFRRMDGIYIAHFRKFMQFWSKRMSQEDIHFIVGSSILFDVL